MVKSEDSMTFPGIICNTVDLPAFKMNIDLYVMVETINKPNESAFATAWSCSQDKFSARPTTGVYELNLAFIINSKMNYLLYYSTFIHEFTHILFFSKDLFKQFRRADNSVIPEAEVI